MQRKDVCSHEPDLKHTIVNIDAVEPHARFTDVR